MARIAIGIPTMNSAAYIFQSLCRIHSEISSLATKHDSKLYICVNGAGRHDLILMEVDRFVNLYHPSYRVIIIDAADGGKNRAMNRIVYAARENGDEIIHFLDDDIVLDQNTLNTNTECLLRKHEDGNSQIVLVGAHFRAVNIGLIDFLKRENGVSIAVKKWFWHNVFRVPFDSPHDSPEFCSGQCMGVRLEYIPELPDDSTGITDDTFLSNYAAINGTIEKPPNSIVYFNTSCDPIEWEKQQKRTYLGIIKARDHFVGKEAFIEKLNRWPYCHLRQCRFKPTKMSLRRRLFYSVFLKQSARMSNDLDALDVLDWGTASSTKNFT